MYQYFKNPCVNCQHDWHKDADCKDEVWPSSGTKERCHCPKFERALKRDYALDANQSKRNTHLPRRIPVMPKEYTDFTFEIAHLLYPKSFIAWFCVDCEYDAMFYEGDFGGPCHRCGSPNTFILPVYEQLADEDTYAL